MTPPRELKRLLFVLSGPFLAGCSDSGPSAFNWMGSKGERWTIECMILNGDGCAESAQQIADSLKRSPGISPKKVWIRSGGTSAAVYYGEYYRKVGSGTRVRAPSQELDQDLLLLRDLVDGEGRRFFLSARRVPYPSQAAEEPKWNLRNAHGDYTLQIGVYYNDDRMYDRQKAAVAKVRQLRRKGFNAYYYHGDTHSIVSVGAFGPEAVVDHQGKVSYIDRAGERHQIASRYSAEVIALQQKTECKYNLTNDNIEYNIDPLKGEDKSVPVRSMLVAIPKEEQPW